MRVYEFEEERIDKAWKNIPPKERIQWDASLLLSHREEKISLCTSSFCFMAFSSSQIFFLQHNDGFLKFTDFLPAAQRRFGI